MKEVEKRDELIKKYNTRAVKAGKHYISLPTWRESMRRMFDEGYKFSKKE